MNALVKSTGFLPQEIVFRTKYYYENKKLQGRNIKGPAIIISNHTSVYDYAQFIFSFPTRTLRYQMAEVLFKKKPLAFFLRAMGGIYVNRDTADFSFVQESVDILAKGGVVGIFPESRLPREGEERPLPFKASAALIALMADVPVIPVYTNGAYFSKKRARVVIGAPLRASDYCHPEKKEKENLKNVTDVFYRKVIELKELLDGQE